MKKILSFFMAIVCTSALICSLASCALLKSAGGDDGEDVTVSEKVTEEEWREALKLSTDFSATFVEVGYEGEEMIGRRELEISYVDGLLTYEMCMEEWENGKLEESETELDEEEIADLTIEEVLSEMSLVAIGAYDYSYFTYSDSCYMCSGYIYEPVVRGGIKKVYFKDSRIVKIVFSAIDSERVEGTYTFSYK